MITFFYKKLTWFCPKTDGIGWFFYICCSFLQNNTPAERYKSLDFNTLKNCRSCM